MKENKGRLFPQYPLPAVSALILNKSKSRVVLVRRGASPGRGLWSLPGGAIEVGEDLEEAVKREVLEETGLEVIVDDLFSVTQYVETSGKGVRYHYVILTFVCYPKEEGVHPRAGGDALEARWISLSNVSDLELTKTTRAVLEKLTKGTKSVYLGSYGPDS